MEVDIKFSIIIPVFNKAKTIISTLNSVLNQSFENFEVIIVNDGSTDQGMSVIHKHTNDIRVRIIEQVNLGVSSARNRGVAESKYDNIVFLDADDRWLPEYLATIYLALRKFPNAGMICCAGLQINVKTNETSIRLAEKYKEEIRVINYFENPHVFSHTSATVVSKFFFNSINGFLIDMKKNEDFALFYSIALISPVVYCGYPLSCYYGGIEGQSTSVNRIDKYASELDVCKRFNITYNLWDKEGRENRLFEIFLKYELRHIVLSAIKLKDYQLIRFYINNLEKGIIRLFPSIEIKLHQNPSFHKINWGYLLYTKVLWRMRGYPRVSN